MNTRIKLLLRAVISSGSIRFIVTYPQRNSHRMATVMISRCMIHQDLESFRVSYGPMTRTIVNRLSTYRTIIHVFEFHKSTSPIYMQYV
jgi:hypothetical protein